MKKLIFLILMTCLYFGSFAQLGTVATDLVSRSFTGEPIQLQFNSQPPMPEVLFTVKNDTLIVLIGKYKFIKVGDKVYKIEASLVEVEQSGFHGLLQSGIDTIQTWRNPIYLPKGTFQSPNYYN